MQRLSRTVPKTASRFRCSVPYLYRSLLLFNFVMTPIIGLVLLIGGDLKSYLTTVSEALLTMIVISALEGAYISWKYQVEVTCDGIYANTQHRGRRYMTWAEMEVVKPIHSFGMPYLSVTSFQSSKPPLLIPRYLVNPKGFQEAVSDNASQINPLRYSLENGSITAERARIAN